MFIARVTVQFTVSLDRMKTEKETRNHSRKLKSAKHAILYALFAHLADTQMVPVVKDNLIVLGNFVAGDSLAYLNKISKINKSMQFEIKT